jgi:hypothetical protein
MGGRGVASKADVIVVRSSSRSDTSDTRSSFDAKEEDRIVCVRSACFLIWRMLADLITVKK